MTWKKLAIFGLVFVIASAGISKNEDLECMFLGYPDLEYDGFDRTEVNWEMYSISSFPGSHGEKFQQNCFRGRYKVCRFF